MIISTTRFTLKSWKLYLAFFIDTVKVVKQVKQSGGLIRVKIRAVELRTITAWKTREALLEFRNSGMHLHAMKKSASYGSIVSTTWDSDSIPTWSEAIDRLNQAAQTKTRPPL